VSVRCNACGEEWNRHPALIVECPQCGAAAHADCVRPSGHSGPFIEPHAAREQLAVDRGLLALCPEGATMKGIPNVTAPNGTENRPGAGSLQPPLPHMA